MKKLKTGVDKKIENVIKEDIFLNILTVVSMILFIISLMIFAKYLQHYMDEQIGTTYELRVYVHWKDGVTDDDEGALNPEELLSVSCKKQSNGKYWVSTNYFIDGCEVNKDEYL